MMQEYRIIITGGSGFIGTNLVEDLLKDKAEVLNLDINPPLNPKHNQHWTRIDILNYPLMAQEFLKFRPTHLVHIAARTDIREKKSLDGYAVNIKGTENILKAINRTKNVKRAIIASSMLVCRLGYIPRSDDDYAPPNLYGKSKVLTEKLTRNFGLNCTWIIIRPTTIWGPWSERYRDEFFAVLRKGRYIHPGKRCVLKTFGYVGNSIFQIRKLLEAPDQLVHGRTFYIGDPPIDLREWVSEFSKRLCAKDTRVVPIWLMRIIALIGDLIVGLGIKFPLTTFRLKNMITENVLDVDSTLKVTGKLPYSLNEGIDLTIKWLKDSEKDK